MTSIVTTFADSVRLTVPNFPVPMKLLLVSARLQLVLEQNPADACPGKKNHSNPDIAMAIKARAACAEALGEVVRMAYTVSAYPKKRFRSIAVLRNLSVQHTTRFPAPTKAKSLIEFVKCWFSRTARASVATPGVAVPISLALSRIVAERRQVDRRYQRGTGGVPYREDPNLTFFNAPALHSRYIPIGTRRVF